MAIQYIDMKTYFKIACLAPYLSRDRLSYKGRAKNKFIRCWIWSLPSILSFLHTHEEPRGNKWTWLLKPTWCSQVSSYTKALAARNLYSCPTLLLNQLKISSITSMVFTHHHLLLPPRYCHFFQCSQWPLPRTNSLTVYISPQSSMFWIIYF
jgi:hypothetical protein